MFANSWSRGEISLSFQASQGNELVCAHSSQVWLFLPWLLQSAPDLPLPSPSLLSSPHSSADLGFSALALPVLVSLLHVTALPRFSWSVLSCSEAFVHAVSDFCASPWPLVAYSIPCL